MNSKAVYAEILKKRNERKKQYWILLDPDDYSPQRAAEIAKTGQDALVDAVLIGGSLLHTTRMSEFVKAVKSSVSIPVILFPGDATQVCKDADAILFLSLISGRNPANLIGEQVKGAPLIREFGIEPISTGYMLVESGAVTSVEFMSNTRPLPRAKPMIAAAHALAAEYMGMSCIYMEAGSGAQYTVPSEMIRAVRAMIEIPLIVGGGIRSCETAQEKLAAGADIIVTGNMLSGDNGIELLRSISTMIHSYR